MPLQMARLDRHMRGKRPGPLHVEEGLQPGQLGMRGLLRPPEERVLLPSGLERRRRGVVHGAAGRVHPLLQRAPQEAVARLDEPHAVPDKQGTSRLGWSKELSAAPKVVSFEFYNKKWTLNWVNVHFWTHFLSYKPHFASINDESPRERAFVLQCLSGPMSRVLSLKTAIYLGRALPHASSRLPACTERLNRIACLFALASDGVYQATPLLTCWCALTAPSQLFS